jgi:hypothetical protein
MENIQALSVWVRLGLYAVKLTIVDSTLFEIYSTPLINHLDKPYPMELDMDMLETASQLIAGAAMITLFFLILNRYAVAKAERNAIAQQQDLEIQQAWRKAQAVAARKRAPVPDTAEQFVRHYDVRINNPTR